MYRTNSAIHKRGDSATISHSLLLVEASQSYQQEQTVVELPNVARRTHIPFSYCLTSVVVAGRLPSLAQASLLHFSIYFTSVP